MRRRLAGTLLALCLAAPAVRGQQVVPGAFLPLERYLEALRDQSGIPGMSAAIVSEGEIVWEYGFGFQNLASRIRATPDTPYLIGDLTETFAAVLLLSLIHI